MTYGWAILIIALTLGVLYSLGIMNPKNFLPRAPPGSCFVFRPNGPGTTDYVSLQGTCGYLPMYVASFNGGYITIQHNSLLEKGELSIAIWVVCNNVTTGWTGSVLKGFIYKSSGWLLENKQWDPTNRNNVETAFIWSFANGSQGVSWSGNIYGKWLFIVTIYSESLNKAELWINGQLKSSLSPITPYVKTTSPLYFYGGSWVGLKSNVQIYNTALTPQEIQYLYQQGLGGGPVRLQNLVAWWPLNGDAKDYSGNNLHGTIYGGVTFVQNYNPP